MTTRQRLVAGFVGIYLLVQVATPALGLRARADGFESSAFSWHMFSSITDDAGR